MDMKIANVYSTFNVYNTGNFSNNKTAINGKAGSKDSFSMSTQAEDYQTVRKALMQIPDVREDKTSLLETKISAGEYNIDANDIVAKMFQGWNA